MMSVRDTLDLLRDTEEAVETLQRNLDSNPASLVAKANLLSVEKRRRDLIRRLDYALHTRQEDLVRYEINRNAATYPAMAVAASITTFQELVTAVFDALRTAPKRRYTPSSESIHLSTLDFATARSGSVLVSLSIPNERLLLIESQLDMAFDTVRRLLASASKDDIRQFVDTVGIAAISKTYAWADTSASYGLDTVVRWGKKFDELTEMVVDRTQAQHIKEIIEETSDNIKEPALMEGILVGFDADTSYFDLKIGKDVYIRGDLAPGLSRQWTTDLPYRASLLRTTHVKYATGEESTRWTLLGLERLEEIAPEAAAESDKTA